jgi:hypothetical protein
MEFLNLLISLRSWRKACKAAKVTEKAIAATKALDDAFNQARDHLIATQAAGYGFEIGRGQPMVSELVASKDNPFKDPNWRDKVVDNDVC